MLCSPVVVAVVLRVLVGEVVALEVPVDDGVVDVGVVVVVGVEVLVLVAEVVAEVVTVVILHAANVPSWWEPMARFSTLAVEAQLCSPSPLAPARKPPRWHASRLRLVPRV